MDIEERLVLYPGLSDAERREVDEYVRRHPELSSRWEEAREWHRLFRDAGVLGADKIDDEALTWFVVSRSMNPALPPPPLANDFARIQARVEEDDRLRERVAALEERLNLAFAYSNPESQYRRLTNRSHRNLRPPVARQARRRPVLWLRSMAAAVLFAVAAYSVTYVLSEMRRSEVDRLAWNKSDDLALDGFVRLRAGIPENDRPSSSEAYLSALVHLQDAQQSVLGLFPSFDDRQLSLAIEKLEEVIRLEPDDSFLAGEAWFLLGKARLARSEVERARTAFRQVVDSGGRRSAEAAAMLEELEASR